MGLDCSHDCWHGSYSGFGQWRGWIARQLGWSFDQDSRGVDYHYIIPDDRIPKKRVQLPIFDALQDIQYRGEPFMGDWFEDPVDVIDVLMVHSDCDGRIPARFCLPLAERLSVLIEGADPDADWRTTTVRFIEGLIRAANRNEDVDFY